MSQKILEMRSAARKVFNALGENVSNCYAFKGLKHPKTVYYGKNDAECRIAAEQLGEQIRQETGREVTFVPVRYNLTSLKDFAHQALLFMSEFRGKDPDAVVICNTFVASEIIAAEKIAKEQSFDLFFPDFICDINDFWQEETCGNVYLVEPLTEEIREEIRSRCPYERKQLKDSNRLAILLSASETWETAVYAYHELQLEYEREVRVIIVNDLEGTAPQWFIRSQLKRLQKVLRRLASRNVKIYNCRKDTFKTLLETIGCTAITIFLPQLKTWWLKELEDVSSLVYLYYNIMECDIDELMDWHGPIGKQLIYDDILHFARQAPSLPASAEFSKLYTGCRSFRLNRTVYWLNQWFGCRLYETPLFMTTAEDIRKNCIG